MTIKEKIRQRFLPNPYELKQKDLGKRIDFDYFGRVMQRDIGRELHLRSNILQMESIEQSDKRKEEIEL